MEQIRTNRAHAFTAQELRRRADGVLKPPASVQTVLMTGRARRSDLDLNSDAADGHADAQTRSAAVLVPIIAREPEATVLLTKRTEILSEHPGQIAFPGGRMDKIDLSPMETALREAREEIGLDRVHVDVIGFLETYQTITNFRVAPAVAIVSPEFTLRLDEIEVAEAFEVPLRFLMDVDNHQIHSLMREGAERFYYAMPYGERYIWGATAGILHNLYEWLYG